MIEGHGDDLHRYQGKVKYNFSSNIYAGVNHEGLMKHISSLGNLIKSYPEPEPVSLERLIASEHGVRPEEVLVTNGATEAIYLIARVLGEKRAGIVSPTFREYQDACRINGLQVVFISEVTDSADVESVWVCNPNNPTGKVIDKNLLLREACLHPEKLFVIDQAYALYTSLPVVSPSEGVGAGNIILLSSLTKQFAVPGLRIGYAVGSEKLLERIRGVRMPWSVGGISISGAEYLIEHKDSYAIDSEGLHREALRLAEAFGEIGIDVCETDCNFILCRLPEGRRADELKECLVERVGILIRDASNFEGLDSRCFRVAAQGREENDLLIKALKKWIL